MGHIAERASRALRVGNFVVHRLKDRLIGHSLKPIPGVIVERDRPVRVRDGIHLMVNVYRPSTPRQYPAILAMSPYGKDHQPETYEAFKLFGINVGDIHHSDYTVFEGPDPGFWVPAGYVVVHADARGMWKSEGHGQVFSAQNAEDYFDLIEWAAQQPWSSGKVGLSGVSYLAWSQWMVAALNPPHLAAINPWEGFTDIYRDFLFQGGIPESGIVAQIWDHRFVAGANKEGLAEDLMRSIRDHPLDDDHWAAKRPNLASIRVPALVCASWSDQGLHTRGALEGFTHIRSEHKWLYTHGRRKWEVYYGDEAKAAQRQFFDYFLRGVPNAMLDVPRVRLAVRKAYYVETVRSEPAWPLPLTQHAIRYLDIDTRTLVPSAPARDASVTYESAATWHKPAGSISFDLRFEADTELTGPMKLKLWVAADDADDLDLFVAVRKFDASGQEVPFSGYNGNDHDMVAKGWLRVSHRELDPARSTPWQPFHTHRHPAKVQPGQVVPVEIEILSSSTRFERGSALRLTIQGAEPMEYPGFKHDRLVNAGRHRIYAGGQYDSHLLVPLIAEGPR